MSVVLAKQVLANAVAKVYSGVMQATVSASAEPSAALTQGRSALVGKESIGGNTMPASTAALVVAYASQTAIPAVIAGETLGGQVLFDGLTDKLEVAAAGGEVLQGVFVR